MDPNSPYFKQVELLVQMLPIVAKYDCFALKGGTAINLFVRDMQRLSVDIDLTYVPVNTRDEAMKEIDDSFRSLKSDLTKRLPGLRITGSVLPGTNTIYKLLTQLGNTQVKIEISPVMRGVVNSTYQLETSEQTQKTFGYVSVPVVSFNDLYAGKLCAALSRQHPRDLFDISILLHNEGLSDDLISIFLVYLVCGNRPIAELLAPIERNVEQTFFEEFQGMTTKSVTMSSCCYLSGVSQTGIY
jgi:predicted nucleotidyltransferase component of viral defense system